MQHSQSIGSFNEAPTASTPKNTKLSIITVASVFIRISSMYISRSVTNVPEKRESLKQDKFCYTSMKG